MNAWQRFWQRRSRKARWRFRRRLAATRFRRLLSEQLEPRVVLAAPVANPETFSFYGDTPRTVAAPGVLANDTDADSPVGDLTAVLQQPPVAGTLSFGTKGGFTYAPPTGFSGSVSFTYRANDGQSESNSATVTLSAGCQFCTARNDNYALTEDTPLTVAAPGVLVNDEPDPNGNSLDIQVVQGPAHGALSLSPLGKLTYSPSLNYNGADSFTYRASDGVTTSNAATVTLNVQPVNDAPVASNDHFIIDRDEEDEESEIDADKGLLKNDTDVDGDSLTASIVTFPSHGSLTLDSDGGFNYEADEDFSGLDTFVYSASDGYLDHQATVFLEVESASGPVFNTIELALDDAYSVHDSGTLSVDASHGVLQNDFHYYSPAISATRIDGPTHGTLILNPDGSFIYVPTIAFVGKDSFSYDLSGPDVDSRRVGTVVVSVGIPTAVDDAYFVEKNGQLAITQNGVLTNDRNPNGKPISTSVVSDKGPSHGSLVLGSDGAFTYTPNTNYSGTDSFTYQATDGLAITTASVRIAVDGMFTRGIDVTRFILQGVPDVNAAVGPQHIVELFNNNYSVYDKSTGVLAQPRTLAIDFWANAIAAGGGGTIDGRGDPRVLFDPISGRWYACELSASPLRTNVVIAVSNSADPMDGWRAFEIVTGDRELDFPILGMDYDGVYITAKTIPIGEVVVSIPKSDLAVPSSNTPTVDHRKVLVVPDTNALNAPVSAFAAPITDFYGPSNGREPLIDHNLLHTDIRNTTNPGAVSFGPREQIINGISRPIAPNARQPESANTLASYFFITSTVYQAGNSIWLAYETDSDGRAAIQWVKLDATDPDHIQVQQTGLIADAQLDFIRPSIAANLAGDVVIGFTGSGSGGGQYLSAYAAVGRTINGVTTFGGAIVLRQGNGAYELGHGRWGDYSSTAPDPSDMYTFWTFQMYAVEHNRWGINISEIHLDPPSGRPIASDDVYLMNANSSLAVNAGGVLENDSDPDHDPISARLVQRPENGTITLNSDGSFRYQPSADFRGIDVFTYWATDATGISKPATVTLGVGVPVAFGDSYTVTEDIARTVSTPGVLFNDRDLDPTTVTAKLVSDASHGAVSLGSDGRFTYSPAGNYDGADSFTYRALDGITTSNLATVTLIVLPVNDPPTFTALPTPKVHDDSGLQVVPLPPRVSPGPPDEAGQTVTLSIVGNTNPGIFEGDIAIDPAGTLNFTPKPNTEGGAFITVRLQDSGGTANGGIDFSTQTIQIAVDKPHRWYNGLPPYTPISRGAMDVDGNLNIDSTDALLIINYLNSNLPTHIPSAAPIANGSTRPFYDVDGDDSITPTDALLIINVLNAGQGGPVGGEGEAASSAAANSLPKLAELITMMAFDAAELETRRRTGK
jgi:large repetitive protein